VFTSRVVQTADQCFLTFATPGIPLFLKILAWCLGYVMCILGLKHCGISSGDPVKNYCCRLAANVYQRIENERGGQQHNLLCRISTFCDKIFLPAKVIAHAE